MITKNSNIGIAFFTLSDCKKYIGIEFPNSVLSFALLHKH